MGLGGESHAPAALLPGRRSGTIVQEAGWTQGRSELIRKISPPPEFDPRTAQHVASRV